MKPTRGDNGSRKSAQGFNVQQYYDDADERYEKITHACILE